MFSKWREKRRAEKNRRGRLLLSYWDGEQIRHIDPYRAYRQLASHPEINLEEIAPLVDQGQEPETSKLIEVLTEVFGVTRWDDATATGLTDWEIINLLAMLNDYLLGLKKKSSHGPTPPPATA